VGPVSAQKIWHFIKQSPLGQSEQIPTSFSEVMEKAPAPAKAKNHWKQLAYTLDEFILSDAFARPSDMIHSIIHGFYDEYLQDSFDNYESRRQDIEQLQSYADQYHDAEEFLSELSLLGSVDLLDSEQQTKQEVSESLTLSSIHQAKGLEWKVVFLIWLTDGMFPSNRVLESDNDDALQEERRLFYVAITRAKDQLYMTYPMTHPKSYSGDYMQQPSRFLQECPEELMEPWQVNTW